MPPWLGKVKAWLKCLRRDAGKTHFPAGSPSRRRKISSGSLTQTSIKVRQSTVAGGDIMSESAAANGGFVGFGSEVPMQIFQVLVIEDQPLFGDMLQRRLKRFFGKQTLILVAGTLERARHLLRDNKFDLVVTDVGLPGFDPTSEADRLAVIREVAAVASESTHIVMTGSPTVHESEECRRLGCAAYIGKNGLGPDLLQNILSRTAEGEFVAQLPEPEESEADFRLHYSDMTQREEETFNRVLQRPPGTTRAEVFEQVKKLWGLESDETVKKYYKNARAKLARNGLLPKSMI
ncbi:MAG: response regulator [Mesorhizobium sp.]|nr:MAG: response regulator [Mesorhizobium sp.]